jgi:RNA-directed DNA polymerase
MSLGRVAARTAKRPESSSIRGVFQPSGDVVLNSAESVIARVVQQAIAQVLTPIFDPTFSASSFGFRPGRNAQQAIRQVQACVTHGWRITVDLDLARGGLQGLAGEHIEPSEVGTPQGAH